MTDSVNRVYRHNSPEQRKIVQRIVQTQFFLIIFSFVCCSPVKEDAYKFKESPFEIADYGLFDLGVVDINNDDYLDIFTVNHSGLQSLLINNGLGGFSDAYASLEMDQDRQFPGLAVLPKEPPADLPGIYINWVGPELLVRAHQMDHGILVLGRIEMLSAVEITDKHNFKVDVAAKGLPSKVTHSIIEFTGEGEGYFAMEPHIHALPIQFHFTSDLPAENIHVGPNRISPESVDFTIQMRDRHGMGWTDFNQDDRMDVFITRGGLKGTMGSVPLDFWDELLIGTPTSMKDIGRTLGLAKNGCPGRQAAWIDWNADNRLDLYVVCGRGKGSDPNILFQQTSDGHFEDVANQIGLDIQSKGTFLWLDSDQDGDMDLFWSDSHGFFLFKNEIRKFSSNRIESQGFKNGSKKLTMGDYDRDGDLDIFSASGGGNVLFINIDGNFSTVAPFSIGLPKRSQTASWVDYNNDGFLDLHSIPDGLYIQKKRDEFASSSRLNVSVSKLSPFYLIGARTAWFDMDNNGTRDLLLATQLRMKKRKWADWLVKITGSEKRFGGLEYYWKTVYFINKNTDTHWLQVQLTGPPGNPQAIGACVTLYTVDGKQFQQVGCSEGAHYSQGHYRLYFGLGQHSEILSLRIDWPDRKSTKIIRPAIDCLLKVDWRDS